MLIDWFTVVAQVVNFLVLVAILRFFLYRRIIDAIETRKARLASAFREAETREQEAQETLEAHTADMQRLAAERPRRLERLEADMRAERSRMLDELRDEVDAMRHEWQRGVFEERERLIEDLERKLATGTEVVARSALGALAGVELEQQMIETFLRKLDEMEPAETQSLVEALGQSSTVEVTTSFPVLPDAEARIRSEIADHLGVTAPIEFRIDRTLGCGIELRAGGRTVGWSVDRYLDETRSALEHIVERASGDRGDPAGGHGHV
jgi:F-type H+-transporting ATPase subunit b